MEYSASKQLKKESLKQGFSLIEVSIVLMIGGILIGVAFGGYKWLKQSKIDATKSKRTNLMMAIEMYKNEIGQYPKELTELVEGPQDQAARRRWSEAIIKDSDLQDSWGREFEYELAAKGSNPPYDLFSRGSTGEAQIRGTEL